VLVDAAGRAGGRFDPGFEGQFFASVNGLRAGAGLPGYQSDGALVGYARSWARYMAENDVFAHSNISSLLGGNWWTIGENIGRGSSVTAIFNALVASPSHYANMVSTDFTHMGVGVWVADDGRVWTAHVFAG